ncbi:ferric reductase-like transmembrane domain-containing protein [Clostridium sp. 19966]|uniref:ferredoxin reductase family protein n=1 Tax=Clostridium sp. 19966 TaxID=2768166 RepID=UPI0028DD8E3C|nr:ferric reductase-like transmembrane domain-containing protein [Clostridium sp. 19966]MDT8716830.1 ferric reductase-like transmembrane domain-containing protein [Clostridium sp. 19966]
MKKKLGILIILLSVIITYVFWSFETPTRVIPLVTQYSQLLASISMIFFAAINFISTRHEVLDKLFDGMDKSYIYHKYLSMSALLLVFMHDLTISIGKRVQHQDGIRIPRDPYAMFGSFSLYLFIILIATAILAKKLNYSRWKNIHKFMIFAYAMGIYHYYGSADYATLGLSPYSLWMDAVNLIGIASAVYSVFLYEIIAFKYRFKVSSLNIVAKDTLEITGKSLGNSISFRPGQFAFLKAVNENNKFLSHPFTISEAPIEGEIQFTIKGLGDDTKKLFETLKVGDEFKVAGPHGKFNYREGVKNQIWIAGGIGVTPFRSFMQAGVSQNYSVDFFYAYNNPEEGAYTEELEALAEDENVRLHLFNSKERGYVTVEAISNYVNKNEPIDVYFCGPKPMREILKKQFKNSALNIKGFHYEHFQFK